jgi:ribosome assembly protein YihI (activator of Der GTPase)
MSRIKKKRHAGNSQADHAEHRKETSPKIQSAKRKTKLKGNKAGNRNAIESKRTQKKNAKIIELSKHIGSKKSVALLPADKPVQLQKEKKSTLYLQSIMHVGHTVPHQTALPKTTKISPEVEIAKLEDDPRLNDLLEQLDNDQVLSAEDNLWVETQMNHHQALMKQLGWLDDAGEEDLIEQFASAAYSLEQYKY